MLKWQDRPTSNDWPELSVNFYKHHSFIIQVMATFGGGCYIFQKNYMKALEKKNNM